MELGETERAEAIQALSERIDELRESGAERIVLVPSQRTHHRVATLSAVPFALASASPALLSPATFGGHLDAKAPIRVLASEAPLGEAHVPALLAVFEAIAKEGSLLVLVVPDLDEHLLAMLIVNGTRSVMRSVALVPSLGAQSQDVVRFAALAGASLRLTSPIDLRTLGSLARIVVTSRETLVVPAATHPAAQHARLERVGLLYVGGEDATDARIKLQLGRELLRTASTYQH